MKKIRFNWRSVGWLEFTSEGGLIGYRSATFVLISLALTFFSACTTRPQRISPVSSLPTLKYELNYFAGSPSLAFAPVEVNTLHAEDSLAVTVMLVAASQFPADFLAAVESQTHMIKVFPSDKIVAPMARLTKGTRVGPIEDAERFIVNLTDQEPEGAVLLKRFYGVLPPGVTASFNFVESKTDRYQVTRGH